jgi:outer membrane protein TolC
MKFLIPFFLLLAVNQCFSQTVFKEEEFIAVVKKYHPVAKLASLQVSVAKADLISKQGAFDPVVTAENSRKDFGGVAYYNNQDATIKIPTWYGIDLYAGVENVRGARTNPEETIGSINYVGFNLPLLQNMVMDKRRAVLQQAKLMINETEAVQQNMLNDLIREGLNAYWQWWQNYHLYNLIDSSLVNAEKRFTMVKTAFLLGDRPAIDTIEALTQIQSFSIQKAEIYTHLIKSRLELSAYLWRENNTAYELPADVIPQKLNELQSPDLNTLMDITNNHPQLVQYNYKLKSMQIERHLKFQSLLPDIDLKYQQLAKGYDFTKMTNAAWFDNDFRFGVRVSMPLRLSEGRGEYKKAKLKIEQLNLERANKNVQLQTKLKQSFVEWQQTLAQLNLQKNAVYNYELLQKGEETRFLNGESSLFLINSREQKTLEAKQKWVELQAKNEQSLVGIKWSAGILAQ